MNYSEAQEHFRKMYRHYWNLRDTDPKAAQELEREIKASIRLVNNLLNEIRALKERNDETERLLMASIKARTRAEPSRY